MMPWIVGGLATWMGAKLFPDSFDRLFSVLKDVFFWILGQIFELVGKLLSTLNIDVSFLDVSPYLAQLPPEMMATVSYVGFFEGMAIIFGAIVLRSTIVVIPFVGSLVK